MPKKKTPSKVKAESTAKKEKLANPPKQTTDEIDEIFASKKRKNPEVEESKKPKENVNCIPIKEKEKKKKKKSEGSRRKTNDGLAIYSTNELGINKEGDYYDFCEPLHNFFTPLRDFLLVGIKKDMTVPLGVLISVDSMTEAGVKLL